MVFPIFGSTPRRRSVTPGDKSYLLRVSHGKCEHCGNEIIGRGLQAEIHHIVPFSSRGSDNYHNLIVLCPNCHSKAVHIHKDTFRMDISYRLPKPMAIKYKALKNQLKANKSSKKTTTKKSSLKKVKTKRKPANKVSSKSLNTKKTASKKAKVKKTSIRKSTAKNKRKITTKAPKKRAASKRK
jgi:hypothetical protein